jgi:hypothetical protein
VCFSGFHKKMALSKTPILVFEVKVVVEVGVLRAGKSHDNFEV